MSITTRLMLIDDVDDVYKIEVDSFYRPWTKNAFIEELNSNSCAKYIVAVEGDKIIGYGGMWLIINEAHITNIAIDKIYRRKKAGTLILIALMKLAYEMLEIKKMTLEVRMSNNIAQLMYEKYGFKCKGLRKKYYADKEDALIMWCEDTTKYI